MSSASSCLSFSALGHVAVDDAQRQALDDGGLADAGLADQHGVVLGAARQDLDGAADLLVAADHGVELAVPRRLGQVAGVALQRVVAFLGRGAVGGAALAQSAMAASSFSGVTPAAQRLGRLAAVGGEREQQPLGGDEGVAGGLGLVLGHGQHPRQVRLHVELAGAALDLGYPGQRARPRRRRRRPAARPPGRSGCARARPFGPSRSSSSALSRCSGENCWWPRASASLLGGLDRLFGAVRIAVDVHSRPLPADAQPAPSRSTPAARRMWVWPMGHTRLVAPASDPPLCDHAPAPETQHLRFAASSAADP